jgi:hypothetical protein
LCVALRVNKNVHIICDPEEREHLPVYLYIIKDDAGDRLLRRPIIWVKNAD